MASLNIRPPSFTHIASPSQVSSQLTIFKPPVPALNPEGLPLSQTSGHIPGVLPGATFSSRHCLHKAHVHGPVQAGIAGLESRGGAESVVFNGGYPAGEGGDIIWYMGSGGFTCPHTGKLSKTMVCDQGLTGHGNKALAQSLRSGRPVRVIRGSQIQNSPWAPFEGFRYDGLYKVTRQIETPDPTNETTYRCYMWRLERIIEPDKPYTLPVREGMEVQALQATRGARLRAKQDDENDAQRHNLTSMIARRPRQQLSQSKSLMKRDRPDSSTSDLRSQKKTLKHHSASRLPSLYTSPASSSIIQGACPVGATLALSSYRIPKKLSSGGSTSRGLGSGPETSSTRIAQRAPYLHSASRPTSCQTQAPSLSIFGSNDAILQETIRKLTFNKKPTAPSQRPTSSAGLTSLPQTEQSNSLTVSSCLPSKAPRSSRPSLGCFKTSTDLTIASSLKNGTFTSTSASRSSQPIPQKPPTFHNPFHSSSAASTAAASASNETRSVVHVPSKLIISTRHQPHQSRDAPLRPFTSLTPGHASSVNKTCTSMLSSPDSHIETCKDKPKPSITLSSSNMASEEHETDPQMPSPPALPDHADFPAFFKHADSPPAFLECADSPPALLDYTHSLALFNESASISPSSNEADPNATFPMPLLKPLSSPSGSGHDTDVDQLEEDKPLGSAKEMENLLDESAYGFEDTIGTTATLTDDPFHLAADLKGDDLVSEACDKHRSELSGADSFRPCFLALSIRSSHASVLTPSDLLSPQNLGGGPVSVEDGVSEKASKDVGGEPVEGSASGESSMDLGGSDVEADGEEIYGIAKSERETGEVVMIELKSPAQNEEQVMTGDTSQERSLAPCEGMALSTSVGGEAKRPPALVSSDLMILPVQPHSRVSGQMFDLCRPSDPQEGCTLVFDPATRKCTFGGFEVVDDDNDSEEERGEFEDADLLPFALAADGWSVPLVCSGARDLNPDL